MRCDQFVKVSADTAEEAIELAKMDATGIAIAGWAIDSVSLWVDESIDVELVAGTYRAGNDRLRSGLYGTAPFKAAVPYLLAPLWLRSERTRHRATA